MAGGLPVYPQSSKSDHFGTEIQDQPLTQIPSGCGSCCTTLTELSLAPRPMTKRSKFATAKVSLSAKPRKLHANPTVRFFLGTIEGLDWYLTPFNDWENELLLFILIDRLRKGHVLMNQPTSRKRTKDISMKELRSCPRGCLPSPNLLDARKVTNSQIS